MARAGRKRKAGDRYPGGQLKQLVDADRRRREGEMATVLAQPHRKGNRSQLAESALGRFVESNKLRSELYDAALRWAEARQKWVGAAGAPRLKTAERVHGSGNDVDMQVLRKWRERDMEGRDAMRRAGGEDGLRAVVRLAADGLDLAPHTPAAPVIDALLGLAVDVGLLPPSALPVAPPSPAKKPRARRVAIKAA